MGIFVLSLWSVGEVFQFYSVYSALSNASRLMVHGCRVGSLWKTAEALRIESVSQVKNRMVVGQSISTSETVLVELALWITGKKWQQTTRDESYVQIV